jgi:hypothetical protein
MNLTVVRRGLLACSCLISVACGNTRQDLGDNDESNLNGTGGDAGTAKDNQGGGNTLPGLVPGANHVSLLDSRDLHGMALLGSDVVLFGGRRPDFLAVGGAGPVVVFGDTWVFRNGAWAQKHPSKSPPPRYGHGMATLGGKVIVFGGHDASGAALHDTWEWDGVTWTEKTPAHVPSFEFADRIAATTIGAKVVIYATDAATFSVWSWDGSDWTEFAGTKPRIRYPTMATLDGKAYLFGAYAPAVPAPAQTQTWQFDGTTWTLVDGGSPALASGRDDLRAMAALGNRLVLFGADGGDGSNAATWEWDGATWTRKAPAVTAPMRWGHALASMPGKILFFGGFGAGAHNDSWTWDGTVWSEVPPTAPPAGDAAMAARGQKLVRVVPCKDSYRATLESARVECSTWEWDGASWHDVNPSRKPIGNTGFGAAPRGPNVTLLTVESNGSQWQTRTYEWDGADWRELVSAHVPPFRDGFAIGARGPNVVAFGASVDQNDPRGLIQTWEWDGNDWTLKHPATQPSARHHPAMASLGVKTILFGGSPNANGTPRNDTWEWDGENWVQRSPAVSPEFRGNAQSAMATFGDKVLLFGGVDASGKVAQTAWTWDGTDWAKWTPSTGLPPARVDGPIATLGGNVVLNGGGYFATDTWVFVP